MLILEPVAVTQGDDYSEVGLLPLRGVERSAGTLGPLHTLLDDDLRLRKSADGYCAQAPLGPAPTWAIPWRTWHFS